MIRRTPIARSTKTIARGGRPKATRSTPRRTEQHRDRAYLDWLKERGCMLRFSHGCPRHDLSGLITDPAHGPVAGAHLKGPDNEAIPLCRHHHTEQHALTWPMFEAKYGFSSEKEAAAHWAVYQIEKENRKQC